MKPIVSAWAAALLGCCALSTQALAQHAAITVIDTAGNPVTDLAIYYNATGAPPAKIDYEGSTVLLQDVGGKLDLRVEHPTFGTHLAGVKLPSDGKFFVDVVLTGGDVLTKVRPAKTAVPTIVEVVDIAPVGVNGSNDCASAAPIGNGVFAFDTTGATTDGLPGDPGQCNEGFGDDQVNNDVWYLYTADCDGDATIDTCGSLFDTRLAAYDAGVCPPGPTALGCNDDFCSFQSSITFPVTSGSSYLVRVGGFGATDAGSGTLNVSCSGAGGGGCGAATECQDPSLITGAASSVGFEVRDNFTPAIDGSISDVCWWGFAFDGIADCNTVLPDTFTISYYNDDAGGLCPGSLKAGPFAVNAARTETGNLLFGFIAELQWSASHAPVPVSAGECCWIEVVGPSDDGCFFFWETSFGGDGRACQWGKFTGTDFAWCTNVPFDQSACEIQGPPNDLCADAEAISGQGTFFYDNFTAGTDGPTHAVCDFDMDGGGTDNDIWYCWTADCTSDVLFETCGLSDDDTKINVYDGYGTASDANLIACNDDACGLRSSVVFPAVAGNTYKLRVGNFPGAQGGPGAFSLSCITIATNDDCADAIPVAVPSTTSGSTVGTSIDSAPTCDKSVTAPGVWYTATGTGNVMTANTCQNPSFDTKLSVYCGDCADEENLTCVGGNDDFCSFQSEVSWCSQSGSEYLILVHGFGSAVGSFDLTVSDSGTSCTGAVACQTVGACCTGSGQETCVEVSADDCAMLGGAYQGDNTSCGGYNVFSCANAFQDISATGADLGLPDDGGSVVPLGFDFDFFGVTQNSIAVCSNGYLTFGTALDGFTETPLPNLAPPNDLIAPLWDDFSPNQGGDVRFETQGPAGNRVFIAQWTDVPQFNTGDANTFQALLFEADDSIEFRYGTISIDGVSDGTVGVEDASGSAGAQAGPVAAGDCVRFEDAAACPPPECHLVFAGGFGNDTFNQGGHTWSTQLDGVTSTYAVWLDDTPQFQIPPFTNFPVRWGNIRNMAMLDVPYQTYSVQIVMWNPEVFPANPEQFTNVMNVTVWLSGRVDTSFVGTSDNMQFSHEVVHIDGYNYIRFPFSINGF